MLLLQCAASFFGIGEIRSAAYSNKISISHYTLPASDGTLIGESCYSNYVILLSPDVYCKVYVLFYLIKLIAMNIKLIFSKCCFTALLSASIFQVNAQILPGNYTTSWVGNTFVPAVRDFHFVQNFANSMFVEPNGTIYTNAFWDEGAKELGVYKDGQCIGAIQNQHTHADGGAITTNATYVWATVHKGKISRFSKLNYGESGTEFSVSSATLRGLAASSSELYVSDHANNQIKVYSAENHGNLLRSWAVVKPGPLALDSDGNVWVLAYDVNPWGPGTGACIKSYSAGGTLLQTITLAAGVEAKSIAIDKIKNELLVTDIGDKMQVHIYNNITTTPALAISFGTQGGILAAPKGLVVALKFNVPNFAGADENGNIIVWCNGNNPDEAKVVDGDGMGSSVESYTRAGVLNWQMLGLHFVDMGTFDPSTDGADLYTKHEHFTMDYTKPDGQQWTWKGWTVDRKTYSNSDIRLKNDLMHLSTTYIRIINGVKFMFLTTMGGGGFYIYRFGADEILIPCGELIKKSGWTDNNANGQKDAGETTTGMNFQNDMFANAVDKAGTIWYGVDDIRSSTLQSITNGVPIYNTVTPSSVTANPAPFYDVRRIEYDSDNDVMYLSGYTNSLPYSNDWKSCGLVMARYNNWSTGNRTALYSINLPSASAGDGANMVSTAIEKDYIFVMGVQTRGKVWVYSSATGVLKGTMVPGANVGGVSKTGWGDVVNSIAAFKKSNGEYLITVEEDFFGKVLIYRWTTTDVAVTGVTVSPTTASIYVAGTQQLTATVSPSNATVKNVSWSSSNTAIATVNATGLVTGILEGTATITVKTEDGLKTATTVITVMPPPAGTWKIADNLDPGFSWTNYAQDACGTCYQATAHYTNIINSTAQYTFTGTEVEAYCETFSGFGSVNILIDGVLKGTYSQGVAPFGGAKRFAAITGLSNGVHIIKFVAAGAGWTGIDYIQFRTMSVLPLQLISFTAKLENGKSRLKWNTEREVNVSHFDIERSSDGNRFEKIKEVGSKGSGNYNAVDEAPQKGYNYYRLKMVDKDGRFSYSNVEVVRSLTDAGFSFIMYPNPNSGLLVVEPSQSNKPVSVSIFDQHGRLLLVKQITGKTPIAIHHLAKGVYTVKLINKGDVKTGKLVKE